MDACGESVSVQPELERFAYKRCTRQLPLREIRTATTKKRTQKDAHSEAEKREGHAAPPGPRTKER